MKESRLKFYTESSNVEDDASLKKHASTPGLFSVEIFTNGEAQKVHDTSLFIDLTKRIVELEDEDSAVAVKVLKETTPVICFDGISTLQASFANEKIRILKVRARPTFSTINYKINRRRCLVLGEVVIFGER